MNGKKRLAKITAIVLIIAMLSGCKAHQKTEASGEISQDIRKEAVIAVMDTGINYDHPDLKAAMWENPGNIAGLNGTYGYNFAYHNEDPKDDNGHGTHCAGVILNTYQKLADNIRRAAGKEPPAVRLMAIKVMDRDGTGGTVPAIEGYRYLLKAKEAGVNIIAVNNSWGVTENNPELEALIKKAGQMGIASINAAGNTDQNLDVDKSYPAGWHLTGSITVGADNGQGERAAFSCYGAASVDIMAPGTDILSSYFQDAFLSDGSLGTDMDWQIQKSEPVSYYEEATDKNYINVKEFDLKQAAEHDGMYFGYRMQSFLDQDSGAILFIDEYAGGMWKNLGGMPLAGMNFVGSRFFKLTDHPTKVRFVAVGVEHPGNVRILSAGAGKGTGPYFTMSGTSMAAPFVSGTYAALKAVFPNETPADIKARILGGSRREEGLTECKGKGEISFAGACSPTYPTVLETKARQLEKDIYELTLSGKYFQEQGSISVKPEGGKTVQAKIRKWTPDQIIVTLPSLQNGFSDIFIKTGGKESLQTEEKMPVSMRSTLWQEEADLPEVITDGILSECDGTLYLIGGSKEDGSQNNAIYARKQERWEKVYEIKGMDEDQALAFDISAAVLDHKIYVLCYSNLDEKNKIFRFDPSGEPIWQEVHVQLPSSGKSNAGLAALNGKLYAVGGLNRTESTDGSKELPADIWEIDPKSGTARIAAQLEEEKYNAVISVMGNRIFIGPGRKGEDGYSDSCYLFDGKQAVKTEGLPGSGISRENAAAFQVKDRLLLINDGASFGAAGWVYQDGKWSAWDHRGWQGRLTDFLSGTSEGRAFIAGGNKDDRGMKTVLSLNLEEDV